MYNNTNNPNNTKASLISRHREDHESIDDLENEINQIQEEEEEESKEMCRMMMRQFSSGLSSGTSEQQQQQHHHHQHHQHQQQQQLLSSNAMQIQYEDNSSQHYHEQQYNNPYFDLYTYNNNNNNFVLSTQEQGGMMMNDETDLLNKAIIEEKASPEILEFKKEIFNNICELIENQEQHIKEFENTVDKKIFMNLLVLEAERLKYALKSYLRTRLLKISKLSTYIIRNKKMNLLSPSEIQFITKYHKAKEGLSNDLILNHLPSALRDYGLGTKNNNKADNENLVVEPDYDRFVFVSVLKTQLNYTLPGVNQQINLEQGQKLLIKYRHIMNLIESGDVELI